MFDSPVVPRSFFMNVGENSANIALSLTKAKEQVVVRITGGCGYMSEEDANGLYDLYSEAFSGFKGAMMFGGTRMVSKNDRNIVLPGITEVVPRIKKENPDCIVFGVVPRTDDVKMDTQYGFIVTDDNNPWITIPHPDQDFFVLLQKSVDQSATWTDEWQECCNVTKRLRNVCDWKSLLIAYNGGGITEQEILALSKEGWPVLLVNGGGRKTDEYASNEEFLTKYPNVKVCNKDVRSFRNALIEMSILPGFKKSLNLQVINGGKF